MSSELLLSLDKLSKIFSNGQANKQHVAELSNLLKILKQNHETSQNVQDD